VVKIQAKKWSKTKILILCVNVALVIFAALALVVSGFLKNTLDAQKFAEKWSSNTEPSGQVSVFLAGSTGLSAGEVDSVISRYEAALSEAEIPLSQWTCCYSAEGTLSVNALGQSIEAKAMGVGGDFFLFHDFSRLSGSFFSGNDLTQDRVVIDETLAWKLFGASDVSGLEITIGGQMYVIAGVVQAEDDFASSAAYGSAPVIYLPFEALAMHSPDTKITCLEVVMPNPVDDFALVTTNAIVTSLISEKDNVSIVYNTTRYSLSSLVGLISDFGVRSMRQADIKYPYWENAARIIEDYVLLLTMIVFVLLIFPVISLMVLIAKLCRFCGLRIKEIGHWSRGFTN